MTTRKTVPAPLWDHVGAVVFPDGIPPEGPGVTSFAGGYPDAYIEPFTLVTTRTGYPQP